MVDGDRSDLVTKGSYRLMESRLEKSFAELRAELATCRTDLLQCMRNQQRIQIALIIGVEFIMGVVAFALGVYR